MRLILTLLACLLAVPTAQAGAAEDMRRRQHEVENDPRHVLAEKRLITMAYLYCTLGRAPLYPEKCMEGPAGQKLEYNQLLISYIAGEKSLEKIERCINSARYTVESEGVGTFEVLNLYDVTKCTNE